LTVAIAFHNIPEGAACAIPIYVATQSRHKALLVALLSGMVEPCAVLLVASLGPASLTPAAVASLLAGVGGIMLGLSVFELVPQAVELTSGKEASVAVGMGFVIMAAVLGMARM
jgi:ZIP family zinc transporter